MTATLHAIEGASCDLCGARDSGSMRGRVAHLRKEHPAYARGLLLRVLSPVVFMVAIAVLAVTQAPQWLYVVALAISFGLLFFGKVRSRLERSRAGAPATVAMKRMLREGGLAFVLVVPTVALLILLLGRQ